MNFKILLKHPHPDCYEATAIGIPSLQMVTGNTRYETLQKMRDVLSEYLDGGEIIEFNPLNAVPTSEQLTSGINSQSHHTNGKIANATSELDNEIMVIDDPTYGMFEDDPTWDEFLAAVAEFRAEFNQIPVYDD